MSTADGRRIARRNALALIFVPLALGATPGIAEAQELPTKAIELPGITG